jgi:phosphoserine phosphatase RsbU/P
MALLRDLSIKWKLSFALIATGLILVGSYVYLAKSIFESDKISYVFESQAARLESAKGEIENRLQRALLSARSVIATFDFGLAKSSQVGEQIFGEEKALLAVELWSDQKKATLLRFEKTPGALPPLDAAQAPIPIGELKLMLIEKGRFLMSLRYAQAEQGSLLLRAVIEISDLLPAASLNQSVALIQGGKAVAVSDLRGIEADLFDEAAQNLGGGDSEQTRTWTHGKDRFLVSQVPLGVGHLSLLALTPESEALGALGTLFKRSLLFLVFSAFGLTLVSLILARGLTLNLRILTNSAGEIGAGNFDATPAITSGDEMGILARAFTKMSQEIKRLLLETRDKTRMEEELKTASLVQERLLPLQPTSKVGEIEISGFVKTSTECGGDWWYFFTRGQDLFVAIADATGHGTAPALITAAARSIFSRLEIENLSLPQMMDAWNFAVASCAQKHVFMTGLLIRINTQTGEGAFVNAGHEAPYLLREGKDGTFSSDYLHTEASLRVGDGVGLDTPEKYFSLLPNESLVLYTDGLFSIDRPDGKKLSDVRFGRKLAGRAEHCRSAKQITDAAFSIFEEFRENIPLPDDIAIVSIRRQGPVREPLLQSESGEIQIKIST